MVIGIISEGAEDQGVIKNILQSVAKSKEIDLVVRSIRPSLSKDATDLNDPNNQTIGTFQGVKNACISKNDYKRFFGIIADNEFIVIHLDTAEIDQNNLSFTRPPKENNPDYSTSLRNLMINEVKNWLNSEEYESKTLFAIAIEEIESWCLTAFENEDTTQMLNVKNRLNNHLNTKNLTYSKLKLDPTKQKSLYFETFGKKLDFHKIKKLKKYAEKNQSLSDFVVSLENTF